MWRRGKQLIGVGVLLFCSSACGDRVVIAREVSVRGLSSEQLDAGLDAGERTNGSHVSQSHGAGQLVEHPPKVVSSRPTDGDHGGEGGSEGGDSTSDASHSAKSASHH